MMLILTQVFNLRSYKLLNPTSCVWLQYKTVYREKKSGQYLFTEVCFRLVLKKSGSSSQHALSLKAFSRCRMSQTEQKEGKHAPNNGCCNSVRPTKIIFLKHSLSPLNLVCLIIVLFSFLCKL